MTRCSRLAPLERRLKYTPETAQNRTSFSGDAGTRQSRVQRGMTVLLCKSVLKQHEFATCVQGRTINLLQALVKKLGGIKWERMGLAASAP